MVLASFGAILGEVFSVSSMVCEISSSNGSSSSSVDRFFVSGPAAVEVNSDSPRPQYWRWFI
jgi:hypothetical protein